MTAETKGQSKITAKEVIAARKLKVANPEMSMQAIKDKLHLKIHVIMVGRLIRGISHGHIDMCGLKVRPFGHRDGGKPATAKKATKKAAAPKATKKAAKKAAKKTVTMRGVTTPRATPPYTRKPVAKTVKVANGVDGKTAAAGPDAV